MTRLVLQHRLPHSGPQPWQSLPLSLLGPSLGFFTRSCRQQLLPNNRTFIQTPIFFKIIRFIESCKNSTKSSHIVLFFPAPIFPVATSYISKIQPKKIRKLTLVHPETLLRFSQFSMYSFTYVHVESLQFYHM